MRPPANTPTSQEGGAFAEALFRTVCNTPLAGITLPNGRSFGEVIANEVARAIVAATHPDRHANLDPHKLPPGSDADFLVALHHSARGIFDGTEDLRKFFLPSSTDPIPGLRARADAAMALAEKYLQYIINSDRARCTQDHSAAQEILGTLDLRSPSISKYELLVARDGQSQHMLRIGENSDIYRKNPGSEEYRQIRNRRAAFFLDSADLNIFGDVKSFPITDILKFVEKSGSGPIFKLQLAVDPSRSHLFKDHTLISIEKDPKDLHGGTFHVEGELMGCYKDGELFFRHPTSYTRDQSIKQLKKRI